MPLPLYSSSSWLLSSCIAGVSEPALRRNNVGSAILEHLVARALGYRRLQSHFMRSAASDALRPLASM